MEKRSSLDKYRLIHPILEKEISIVQVSKDRGISVRTLSYWIKRFTESGLIGLQKIKRKDIDHVYCLVS